MWADINIMPQSTHLINLTLIAAHIIVLVLSCIFLGAFMFILVAFCPKPPLISIPDLKSYDSCKEHTEMYLLYYSDIKYGANEM